MRSFSLRGMASRAFFGPNAPSLGTGWSAGQDSNNNTIPAGGLPYGSGNSSAIAPATTWTSRGKPFAAAGNGTQVTYANGIFIAAAGSSLWRSTDDGVTWTEVDNTANRGYGQIAYDSTHTTWVATIFSNPGAVSLVVRSTDNGLTWGATIATGVNAENVAIAALNGTLVVGGGPGNGFSNQNYAISTDGGQTWSLPAVTVIGSIFRIISTGSQFVASCFDGVTGINASVATSANGNAWAITQISTTNNLIAGLCFDPVAALYAVADTNSNVIRVASTPAGLATAPNISTSLQSRGGGTAAIGNGEVFVFGTATGPPNSVKGGVAVSTNGGSFFKPGTLNFNPITAAALAVDYDPINKIFVAVGVGGNVATNP